MSVRPFELSEKCNSIASSDRPSVSGKIMNITTKLEYKKVHKFGSKMVLVSSTQY